MPESILIIGASGALGVPLMAELSQHLSSFSRVAILAQPGQASKFTHLASLGFEIISGSILSASSYAGFDTVVSLVGNSVMRLQPAMIDLAITAGVMHFVPSEWNSDISQDELSGMRYFRDKFVTRDHLRMRAKELPSFKYTIFITGIFTEWAVAEFHGVDTEKHTVKTYGRPDALVGITSIPDICKFTVEALLMPFASGVQEREIRVCGETLTWKAFIDALGEAQGPEYKHEYLDPADAKVKEIQARHDHEAIDEMLWSIKPLVASGFGRVPGRIDNGLFSFKAETARETFRRVYGN